MLQKEEKGSQEENPNLWANFREHKFCPLKVYCEVTSIFPLRGEKLSKKRAWKGSCSGDNDQRKGSLCGKNQIKDRVALNFKGSYIYIFFSV